MITTEYKDQSIGIIEILLDATDLYRSKFAQFMIPGLFIWAFAFSLNKFYALLAVNNVITAYIAAIVLLIFKLWIICGIIIYAIKLAKKEKSETKDFLILNPLQLKNLGIALLSLGSSLILWHICLITVLFWISHFSKEFAPHIFVILVWLSLLCEFIFCAQTIFYIIDTETPPFKALWKSIRVMSKHFFSYFALMLIPILAGILLSKAMNGLLAAFIIPWQICVMSVFYMSLNKIEESPHSENK